MNIEQIGTSAVESLLAKTDLLVADIHKNDTLPSWDGEVAVYRTSKHSKDSFIGRVPVQVKCKVDERKSAATMYWRYSVELSDLNNYLNDGGVIYFVVKTNNVDEVVYYNALLPADLLNEISRYGKQKSHYLPFKKIPINPNELQDIFIDFLRHKDYQSNLKRIGFKSIDELFKSGYTDIFFETRKKNPFDLIGEEVYQYAKNSIGDIVCVNKVGIQGLTISKPDGLINVGETNYFVGYEVQKTDNILNITFASHNVLLTFEGANPRSFSMQLGGSLQTHITCLEFALAANTHNGFSIDGIEFELGAPESGSIDRAEAGKTFANNLAVLRKIEKLLSTIHCERDIELTKDLINRLLAVACSLLDNKSVKIDDMNPYGLFRVPVNDKYLIFRTDRLTDDNYIIRDVFKEPFPVIIGKSSETESLDECPHSYFLLLNERDFYDALNLDLNIIHNDVLSHLNDKYIEETTFLILAHYWFKLVKAFDKTGNPLFMDFAKDTLCKLKEAPNISYALQEALFLNDMQLIKRQRSLTVEDIAQIDKLLSITSSCENRVAAYLLKDDFKSAYVEFSALPPITQKRFKTYPIYKFWKN